MATRDQPTTTVMKLLLAIMLLFLLLSGAARAQAVPPFPSNPNVGDIVTGPGGQLYRWDGTKWVAVPGGPYAPQVNPPGGQNNYLPIANPTFTGLLTGPDATLTNSLILPKSNGTPNLMMAGTVAQPVSMLRAFAVGGGGASWVTGAISTTTGWTATLTQAENISAGNGQLGIYVDTGLTVGSAFTPTAIGVFEPRGLDVSSAIGIGQTADVYGYPFEITNNQNGDTGINILNDSAGANADVALYLWNGTVSGNFVEFGTGNSSTLAPPNTLMITNGAPNGNTAAGIALITTPDTNLAPIRIWNQGSIVAQFQSPVVSVMHLGNMQFYTAPTITNGTLMAGSRDTFGYIQASAWPVTMTFGARYAFNPACVAIGAAGEPMSIYNNNQNVSSIQFGCISPITGAECTPGWFSYVCGDLGSDTAVALAPKAIGPIPYPHPVTKASSPIATPVKPTSTASPIAKVPTPKVKP